MYHSYIWVLLLPQALTSASVSGSSPRRSILDNLLPYWVTSSTNDTQLTLGATPPNVGDDNEIELGSAEANNTLTSDVSQALFSPPQSTTSPASSSYQATIFQASPTMTTAGTSIEPTGDLESVLFLPEPSSTALPSEPTSDPTSVGNRTPLLGPIVAGYYPDWVSTYLPPEAVDFSKFDWVDFAFAIPDQSLNVTWDNATSPGLLSRLVTAGHSAGKHVKLSVGGWDGSEFFSVSCGDAVSRQTFANNLVGVYQEFNLDGIDIDWEYPGYLGESNNKVSSQDTENFLQFLKVLRTSLPPSARITATAQNSPFVDGNGHPLTDTSDFADVLDWVLVMNYDINQSSSTPGPNAPLTDGCGSTAQPNQNAASGIQAWVSSQFPASKIMLGVPSYGYINKSNATSLRSRSSRFYGRNTAFVDILSESNSTDYGQIDFSSLIDQGALVRAADGSVPYIGDGGFTRFWDNCSSTPFLTSPYVDQVITYDDTVSLGLKAAYAREAGILGVEMFEISGDTPQWDLMTAIRQGLTNTTATNA